jgi:sulfur-oxidizing protein SoxZ
MGSPMRVRATESGGITDVKVLMKHDMETGQRKGSDGKVIPEWFITNVTAKVKDNVVFEAHFGASISKDPFLHFKTRSAAKGDKVVVTWIDNKGDTRTDEAVVN